MDDVKPNVKGLEEESRTKRSADGQLAPQTPQRKKTKNASFPDFIKSTSVMASPQAKRLLNEDDDPYWELSQKRRLTIQKFKGKTLIALREYYDKDGKMLPGKQGISLTLEQYAALVKSIPQVTEELKKRGDLDIDGEDNEPEE